MQVLLLKHAQLVQTKRGYRDAQGSELPSLGSDLQEEKWKVGGVGCLYSGEAGDITGSKL